MEKFEEIADKLTCEELRELIKERKATRGKADIIYLNWQILGHPDITAEDYGAVAQILTKSSKNTLILMPRGTLKTALLESYIIQSLLNNPTLRILYILETKEKARWYLGGIKKHIESPSFKAVYGDIRDMTCWREDAIRVKGNISTEKEPNIMIASLESGNLTGFHPDLIVADDLHSEANTRTEYQIDLAKSVFTELVNLGTVTGGFLTRQVVLGTPWLDKDIYCTIAMSSGKEWSELLKNKLTETEQWNVYIRSGIESCPDGEMVTIPGYGDFPNSRVVFPKLPLEVLIAKWQQPTMTRYVFSCQHLCDPTTSKNTEFTKEDLEYASGEAWEQVKDKPLYRSMLLLDPAYSTSCRSDYSAFCFLGYTESGVLRIDMALREKLEPHQLVDQVFAMRLALKPTLVGIESNGVQIMSKWIKDKRNEKQQFFKIVEIKTPHNSKELRIKALNSLFKSKKIAISPECIDLLQEFKDFPNSSNDDLMDCVSFVLNEALIGLTKSFTCPKQLPAGAPPFKQLPNYRPIIR